MTGSFLAKLFHRQFVADDAFVRVTIEQSENPGSWSVDLHLLGSTQSLSASFSLDRGLVNRLGIDVPESYRHSDGRYIVAEPLTLSAPLRITLFASQLAADSGLVYFQFEAKRKIGGSMILCSIPIGLADSCKLQDYAASHARRFAAWQERQAV